MCSQALCKDQRYTGALMQRALDKATNQLRILPSLVFFWHGIQATFRLFLRLSVKENEDSSWHTLGLPKCMVRHQHYLAASSGNGPEQLSLIFTLHSSTTLSIIPEKERWARRDQIIAPSACRRRCPSCHQLLGHITHNLESDVPCQLPILSY